MLNEKIVFELAAATTTSRYRDIYEERRRSYGDGLVLLNTTSHDESNYADPFEALVRFSANSSIDGAPNLPSGYATLIGLTYIPPLWRRMMDHRVIEHYDGDITKVNVHPRVRNKVMAKYGVA